MGVTPERLSQPACSSLLTFWTLTSRSPDSGGCRHGRLTWFLLIIFFVLFWDILRPKKLILILNQLLDSYKSEASYHNATSSAPTSNTLPWPRRPLWRRPRCEQFASASTAAADYIAKKHANPLFFPEGSRRSRPERKKSKPIPTRRRRFVLSG